MDSPTLTHQQLTYFSMLPTIIRAMTSNGSVYTSTYRIALTELCFPAASSGRMAFLTPVREPPCGSVWRSQSYLWVETEV